MKASKITHRNDTRIRVDFPYNQEFLSKLRQIPDTKWSKTMKAWHIPYSTWNAYELCWELSRSDKFMAELPLIAERNGLTFLHHLVSKGKLKPRISRHDIENYRECPEAYVNKLKELRYGQFIKQ